MLVLGERLLKEAMIDIPKLLTSNTNLHDLVQNYKRFLNVNYSKHVKPYGTRLKNQPEGATAEAVVYSFLEANLDDVQVAEDFVKGGPDFRCRMGDTEFLAEVASLESKAASNKSGLSNERRHVGCYRKITNLLQRKALRKAKQMSGHNCPRVLVMTCQHSSAGLLLGIRAAQDLLTSDTKIAIGSISSPVTDHLVTHLDHSVFFRWENGNLESCRRSISAILLFSISGVSAFITGILHPDPIYQFPFEFLPSVPFVRLMKWPPENNNIEIEWVRHNPVEQGIREGKQLRFWYDEALRNI